jgi:hypothetical protein
MAGSDVYDEPDEAAVLWLVLAIAGAVFTIALVTVLVVR